MREYLGGSVQRVLQLPLRDQLLLVFCRVFYVVEKVDEIRKAIKINANFFSCLYLCSVSCASRGRVGMGLLGSS